MGAKRSFAVPVWISPVAEPSVSAAIQRRGRESEGLIRFKAFSSEAAAGSREENA
jgi:hypothetical protein